MIFVRFQGKPFNITVIQVYAPTRDIDVYNGLLDSEGEGEGGMIWENDILTILTCKN